ncbi:hypothetical protein [Chryseobacterium sp. Mn2064]|uniref:hypothetical protein n=1 Tax=Chryseobacterium sp. Mn2064 TaxID=3395263 RepID=UPI003BDC520F
MKKKLRKIIIDEQEYVYCIKIQYHSGTDTSTLRLKVFLNGYKKTPLIIDFLTLNNYYVGQPLKFGIILKNKMTNSEEVVNLNEPGYIKRLIVHGQKSAWTGIKTFEIQNGLTYLEELGFETDDLKIPNYSQKFS